LAFVDMQIIQNTVGKKLCKALFAQYELFSAVRFRLKSIILNTRKAGAFSFLLMRYGGFYTASQLIWDG